MIIIRHGARGHDCADPVLYDSGVEQAKYMAEYMKKRFEDDRKKLKGLYSSM